MNLLKIMGSPMDKSKRYHVVRMLLLFYLVFLGVLLAGSKAFGGVPEPYRIGFSLVCGLGVVVFLDRRHSKSIKAGK